MKKFCAAVGITTMLAGGLGGCVTMGATSETPVDAYASGKENFAAGRLGLALVDFERALEEHGPSVDRLNALAATYDRLSRFDLADRAYRQALVLDPNSPQTLNNLGYSYMLRGRADLAAAYLAKAQSLAKGDPTIGANLAIANEAIERPAIEPASVQQIHVAEPAPVKTPKSGAIPSLAFAGSMVTLVKPEHGTYIKPVTKGVFQLVTLDEEVAVPTGDTAPVVASSDAYFEIPRVIEPMPAVTAVPVSAVHSEPLAQLEPATLVVSPVSFPAPALPMAGVIRASAQVHEEPLPATTAAPETAPAISSLYSLLHDAFIEVSNGSGIERSGARFRAFLRNQGVPVKRLTNDARFGHAMTVLYYREGFLDAARAVASELPMPIGLEQNNFQRSDLRLRLGLDSKTFDNYLTAGIITASR
jgi:hypothetical protein